MKIIFTKTSLLLTGILIGSKLFAQTTDTTQVSSADYVKPFSGDNSYRTWSVGVQGGILTTYTVLGSNKNLDFTSPNAKIGYGGYVKRQITPAFGIQGDFLAGKLTGDNSQVTPSGKSYDSFSTTLHYAFSLSANVTVGNISWHDNKSAIQPYVTVGGGFMNYTPSIQGNGTDRNFKNANNGVINEFFVPVGVGLKFNVAKGINIDLGYQVNFDYNDNLDGFKYGSGNDKFSFGHIGLEFALGRKSVPQLAVHNPVSSMRTEYLTENQNTKTQLQTQIDTQKAQNDQLKADLAVTNATLAKFTTDSDADGVADYYDKCPNTPAGTKVDGSGCPLPVAKEVKVYVTEEDRRVVKDAILNLEFDSGRATIRDHSYPSLDKVANLLISKNFSLKLAGHTDNVGSNDLNMRLSKDRAESIKSYLVSKGANASRIEAIGYGETQPIASNKTKKGRQQNRRVEFTLF